MIPPLAGVESSEILISGNYSLAGIEHYLTNESR
jgi:hypothetical protein